MKKNTSGAFKGPIFHSLLKCSQGTEGVKEFPQGRLPLSMIIPPRSARGWDDFREVPAFFLNLMESFRFSLSM